LLCDLSEQQLARIAELLGRQPRGLLALESIDDQGEPAVLRVAPLVDSKPFPTLFWLIHPAICYWLDGLEANGVIGELQALVDSNNNLQQALEDYHHWYIAERWESASVAITTQIDKLGYKQALETKGVGGLGSYGRIRCLHTWYGAHLVKPNAVGAWLDGHPEYAFLARQKNTSR